MNFGFNGRWIFRVGVVDDVRSFETSQRSPKTESGIKSYGQNGEGLRAVFLESRPGPGWRPVFRPDG